MRPHQQKYLHIEQLPPIDKRKLKVRTTNLFEKLGASIFNALIALGLATPFLILFGPTLYWRISIVVLFGLYESFIFLYEKDRCFGMKIMDTYWRRRYSFRTHLLFNIFYTLSFATIVIYIWFPLDLLLINLLLIQLPFVLITGTTFHGFLSNMHTVKIVAKNS
jgi:hypothetical protein